MEEKLTQQPTNCLKAVFFGPESTGKSTLASQLAAHYHTLWVPEYMREYLQEKWDTRQLLCEPKDLLPIALGQMQLENKLARKADKILFCDTNLLQLKVYSEAYYDGYCDPKLLKAALNNRYSIYFLTNIDIPWVADDLRDKPHDREGMFQKFKRTLTNHRLPYIELRGGPRERMLTAVNAIDELLK